MNRIVMNEERQLASLKSERNPNSFIRKLPSVRMTLKSAGLRPPTP